jgi:hypothetical protein
VLFVSDGDITQLMQGLSDAGVDGFVVEGDARLPRSSYEAYAAKWGGQRPIFFKPNYHVMVEGTPDDAREEGRWLAGLAKRYPGIFNFASMGGTDDPVMREAFYRSWVENRRIQSV